MPMAKQKLIIEEFMASAGGFRESRVMLLGMELGVFQALASESQSAEALARRLRLVLRAVVALCNALTALGWLKKKGDVYSLLPALRPYLHPGSKHNRVHALLHTTHVFHAWARLDAVARGEIKDPGKARKQRRTRETHRDFIMAMQQMNPARADELAALLDLSRCRSFCDVGPGPGHYSVALAKKYPQMRFTLVDDADSLEIAREFVGKAPRRIASRFKYVVGDAVDGKRPDWGGPFDAVFVSNVIHIFGDKENRAMVRNLAHMLSPGGVLIVRDFAINDEHTAPPMAALFAINMLANTKSGGCYSEREVKAWMKAAGLTRMQKLDFPPSYLVLGYK